MTLSQILVGISVIIVGGLIVHLDLFSEKSVSLWVLLACLLLVGIVHMALDVVLGIWRNEIMEEVVAATEAGDVERMKRKKSQLKRYDERVIEIFGYSFNQKR